MGCSNGSLIPWLLVRFCNWKAPVEDLADEKKVIFSLLSLAALLQVDYSIEEQSCEAALSCIHSYT